MPSGRINPYLGIGPAIVWTSVKAPSDYLSLRARDGYNPARSANFGDSAMNVALVVEPGVRFMVMRNVSIDVAMRYRYSAPSYEGNGVTIKTNALNQFAPLVRANYHF